MVGKVVSHYKILEHLGEGRVGVVYKAHHLGLRDRERTFAWLEKAFQEHGNGITNLGHEARPPCGSQVPQA
jgi:hypothetical protein